MYYHQENNYQTNCRNEKNLSNLYFPPCLILPDNFGEQSRLLSSIEQSSNKLLKLENLSNLYLPPCLILPDNFGEQSHLLVCWQTSVNVQIGSSESCIFKCIHCIKSPSVSFNMRWIFLSTGVLLLTSDPKKL